MKKSLFTAVVLSIFSTAGCVVNPDADKALRTEARREDSISASGRGVVPVAPDTGQYAMPVAPMTPGEMPVVSPADSARVMPK